MIRYVITVVLLVPAVSQAQAYLESIAETSLYEQRDSVGGRCLVDNHDAKPSGDSELVLQHRLSIAENDRYRTNLYVGILWSIVWGGAVSQVSEAAVGYACSQRSTP